MLANLILQLNEVTIRDYSLIEDEGLQTLVSAREHLSITYEDDEESPGRHIIVIKAPDLKSLLSFLDFTGLPVKILT